MIPLNKPKIHTSVLDHETRDAQSILRSQYDGFNVALVFSARQGLDLIYKHIYERQGTCRVAVSPLTCYEALYPIISNNHMIEFVDIDAQTFNMDEHLIPLDIDVIQAIHFGGNPQKMDLIKEKAKMSSAIIVEDCAQGFGSTYNDVPLGSYGDFSAFSLSKNLYALAGGFVLSKSDLEISSYEKASFKMTVYKRLKRFLESKNSIKTPVTETLLMNLLRLKPESTSFIFSQYTINDKMFNSITQQLSHHTTLISQRKKVAHTLKKGINNPNLVEQKIEDKGDSCYTRLLYRLKDGDTRDYIDQLRRNHIWANHLSQNTLANYQPDVYTINEFKDCAEKTNLKNYDELHNKILCVPVSPSITKKEMDHIIYQMNKV